MLPSDWISKTVSPGRSARRIRGRCQRGAELVRLMAGVPADARRAQSTVGDRVVSRRRASVSEVLVVGPGPWGDERSHPEGGPGKLHGDPRGACIAAQPVERDEGGVVAPVIA